MGRTAESTILVVAGNKLRLDVPITGDPAPTVVWTKSEKVKKTGRLTIIVNHFFGTRYVVRSVAT